MERKFESELGKSIADGSRKKLSERAMVCAVTLSVCAIMASSAAFLLPAMSIAEGNALSADVYSETDYLVYDEVSESLEHYVGNFDGEYDVKKSTNVKAMAYHAQGTFVKFSYTTNVQLDTVDNLDLYDGDIAIRFAIAELTIPYVSSGATGGYVPWDMTVGDVSWDYNDVVYDIDGVATGASVPTPASSWYDGSAMRVNIGLPVLPVPPEDAYVYGFDENGLWDLVKIPSAYESGDEVTIHAQIRVTCPDDVIVDGVIDYGEYADFLDGLCGLGDVGDAVTEDAFPTCSDADDSLAAVIATVESVAMGDMATLETLTRTL
ncbi:MAG: hypothetical protein WBD03_01830 [Thermoplasmata archaeon]